MPRPSASAAAARSVRLDFQTTANGGPILGEPVQEVKLPANVTDVVAGGGGRYRILALKSIAKLGVFDIDTESLRFLPTPNAGCLVAAGEDKLITIQPASATITRWNLRTLDRELELALPTKSRPTHLALGAASSGHS